MTDIKLPFGLNENNLLVHIEDIEEKNKGKKCGCVCPSCKTKLQAVKAKKKQPHFRHDYSTECEGGLESAIHMAAKQIIIEKKSITLPKYDLIVSKIDSRGKEHTVQETIALDGVILHFDSVQEEVDLHGIRPDILATTDNGQFIIEILYTHEVDNDKRNKIIKSCISAIEINLSKLRPEDVKNWEAFWAHINDPNNTKWLNYIQSAADISRLETMINTKIHDQEEEYKKESVEELNRWQEEHRCFVQALDDIKYLTVNNNSALSSQQIESHYVWKNYCSALGLSPDKLPEYLNANIPGSDFIFGCDRRLWQTALYCHFIFHGARFTIRNADLWLQTIGCRTPASARIVEKYTIDHPQFANSDTFSNISSAWGVLHAYFCYFCELGILQKAGGSWGNTMFSILSKIPTNVITS